VVASLKKRKDRRPRANVDQVGGGFGAGYECERRGWRCSSCGRAPVRRAGRSSDHRTQGLVGGGLRMTIGADLAGSCLFLDRRSSTWVRGSSLPVRPVRASASRRLIRLGVWSCVYVVAWCCGMRLVSGSGLGFCVAWVRACPVSSAVIGQPAGRTLHVSAYVEADPLTVDVPSATRGR